MVKHPDVQVLLPVYGTQHRYYWLNLFTLLSQVSPIEEGGYFYFSGCYIDWVRNGLAEHFMASDKEWSLWIDDDIMAPPDTLELLKSHNKPFVSGLYLKRGAPYVPCAWRNDEETGQLAFITKWTRGELLEVDGTGFGCVLIHRSVFEDIKKSHVVRLWTDRNWPILKIREEGEVDEEFLPVFKYPFFYGLEDIWFCDRAKAAGHKIYLDTSIECVHLNDAENISVDSMLRRLPPTYWSKEGKVGPVLARSEAKGGE